MGGTPVFLFLKNNNLLDNTWFLKNKYPLNILVYTSVLYIFLCWYDTDDALEKHSIVTVFKNIFNAYFP